MPHDPVAAIRFETGRLLVGPWHDLAAELGIDLDRAVSGMLTDATTRELPDDWSGDFSVERAHAWISERDRESPTLLVVDQSSQPLGLLILFETSLDRATSDIRVGYLFAESAWGRGLATELIGGLIDCVRDKPAIRTLTAGVSRENHVSARALTKNNFELVSDSAANDLLYRLDV